MDALISWFNGLGQYPGILLAILVFLIGWAVAAVIGRGIRSMLEKAKWDDRLFEYAKIDGKYKPHVVISKLIYYILMVLVLILFFNVLGLQFVAEPLVHMMSIIAQSIPNIVKAALILLFAWLLASLLNFLIQKGGKKLGIDRLLAKWKFIETEAEADTALQGAGRIVFYLVLLIFIPGVLGALNIAAVSDPLSGMLAQLLQFLPKLFGASLTLLVGWMIARIVREIVSRFLHSIGLEKASERLGLSAVFSKTGISSVIGTIAYILILIPAFIAALETLALEGISGPAIAMLTSILSMIPNIIVSVLLVLAGVWLGRVAGEMSAGLLEKLGFNGVWKYLGIGSLEPSAAKPTVSQIAGRIVQILVILLFAVEALHLVNLQVLVGLVTAIIAYLPNLLVAVIILGLGLFLGNFVQRILSSLVRESLQVLGAVAKYTVITLSLFMALDQLGVASSIVNTAFMLTLGGLALAFGLAFGLGGRDAAAGWLKTWSDSFVSPSSASARDKSSDTE